MQIHPPAPSSTSALSCKWHAGPSPASPLSCERRDAGRLPSLTRPVRRAAATVDGSHLHGSTTTTGRRRRHLLLARPGHQQLADDVEDPMSLDLSAARHGIHRLGRGHSHPPGSGSNSSYVGPPIMNHPQMLSCCLVAPISQVCTADARLS
ncbi:unnamed protein product [Urochloa humidicola]